ncbi:hypothetical protein COO60DRAFT_18214 [Scenedesmus sp. NREL 46B-D3]|nr:hypothetical protein COO60DRAFT_18214 [Scenedesmus sp. NREL 46B-D3]
MVALARNSCRRSGSLPGPADGVSGAAAGLTRPSGGRSLASRSVGMAGAYSSFSRAGGGPQAEQQGQAAAGSRFAAGASSGGSLATRSVAPHIPPVAPLGSSLYKVSTGLGGYKPGVSAAVATAAAVASANKDGAAASSSGRRHQQGAPRSLACSSMPAQQVQQGVAGAAARGRLLPSTAGFAAAGSRRDDANDVSNDTGADDAAPGSMLDVVGKALGRISRMSAALGTGSAAAAVAVAAPARGSVGRAGAPEGDSSDLEDAASSLYKESHGLGKTSSYGTGSVGGVSAEELADARSWLLSGLKRYFHGKRMEGLLSARGLRILDAACEVGLEDASRPLRLWGSMSRDATHSMLLRVLTVCLFVCRRASVRLHANGTAGRWLAYPPRVAARMLQRPLNQVLLSSVEVAMEYLMGLTTSPYVEMLQEGDVWAVLIGEIQAETSAAAQFLIDREIEAPERYSAVQSYRVAMAVLRQQRLFVESLFESGMLDAAEQSQLAHPIESAERRLELLGPVWKAPSLGEVLRQLPFMRGQGQRVVDVFIKYGHLVMLGKGSRLPQDKQLYIVQSGIVKVSYAPDLGAQQEYFLGAGGVFNLYTALTGEELPGATDAVAQGNALGKGPVLFCVSAKGLRHLSMLATAGDPAYQQLELDMHRLAGLFLLERLQPQMDLETSQALARLAPLHARGDGRPGQPRRKHMSRQQRAAWVRQHLTALRQHLKQQLVKSELLVLPAGCAVAQESHVMMLQGSIQVRVADDATMADAAAAEVARWMVSAGRHSHQSMLPWLWEVLGDEDLACAPAGLPRQPLPVTITAGPEGAMLLVCPSAAEEAAMAAGTAAEALAAAQHTSTGMRRPPTAATRSAPTRPARGPQQQQQQQQQQQALQMGSPRDGLAAANPLLRVSSGSSRPGAGFGAAAAGMSRGGGGGAAAAAAGRAAGLSPQGSASPFLRRTMATAAAADAVMEPMPGRGYGAGPTAAAGAGTRPGPASNPAAAAASKGAPSLSRHSPTTRDLARISPIPVRRVSSQPLAGAAIDNRVLVGASSGGGAAAGAGVGGMESITSDQEHSSGEEQQQQQELVAPGTAAEQQQRQQAAAAALPRGPEPRRTRSVKPLRAGGGKDAANLR